jgi:hypothetical protein
MQSRRIRLEFSSTCLGALAVTLLRAVDKIVYHLEQDRTVGICDAF